MTDPSQLDERLRAVERALTGTDRDLTAIADAGEVTDCIEELDERLSAVETQVTELEAAVQAIRGYVGSVRAVNREVEGRSDTALATARAVERRLEESRDGVESPAIETPPSKDGAGSSSAGDSTNDGHADGSSSGERDRTERPAGTDDPASRSDPETADGNATDGAPTPDPDRVPDPWASSPWESRNREDSAGTVPGWTPGESADGQDDGRSSDEQHAGDETAASPDRSAATGPVTDGWEPVAPPASDGGDDRRESTDPDACTPGVGDAASGRGPADDLDGGAIPLADLERGTRVVGERDPAGDGDESDVRGSDSDPGAGADDSVEGWWVPDDDVDIERTEPWSVPDPVERPVAEDDEDDESLLARFREAL